MERATLLTDHRYSEANNKYMKNYDESKPSKYITYLDANNLYGWAMNQYLPSGGFMWMTDKEINKVNFFSYKEDSKTGLILEVNLEYPKELRKIHNIMIIHVPQSKLKLIKTYFPITAHR